MKTIGRYLKDNNYYIGSLDNGYVWVCVDASNKLERFKLHSDERGQYFKHWSEKIYLDYA